MNPYNSTVKTERICLIIGVSRICIIATILFLSSSMISDKNISTIGQPQQDQFIIYGKIYGPSNTCATNATIHIINPLTNEVIEDEADENGSYSNNLANFNDGWEDGQKIILLARYNVSNRVEIYPKKDNGGMRKNISLPALQILSPSQGMKLEKKLWNLLIL